MSYLISGTLYKWFKYKHIKFNIAIFYILCYFSYYK